MEAINILLIDDQPEILEILFEIISEDFEASVETSTSPDDAMKLMLAKKYSIICTDYIMPELRGTELIKMVRNEGGLNADTPFVLLTGNEDEAKKELGDVSNVEVLNKVDEINNIVETLRLMIEGY